MKLLGSTESKITGEKNGENVPHLEIVELVLIHCNIVNNLEIVELVLIHCNIVNNIVNSRILYTYSKQTIW